jgi:hypothetical protein
MAMEAKLTCKLSMEEAVLGMHALAKRKGVTFVTGANPKVYNGVSYFTKIYFKTNRSKNYKDIIAYLRRNDVPYAGWPEEFGQAYPPSDLRGPVWQIKIQNYKQAKCFYCKEESSFDEETCECDKCGRIQNLADEPVKCLYCKEESTFDEETTECAKCGRYQDLYGEFSDDESTTEES